MYNQDNVKLDNVKLHNLTFLIKMLYDPTAWYFLKQLCAIFFGEKNEPNLIKNGILFPKLF